MKITLEYNDGSTNTYEQVPYGVGADIEKNLHRLMIGLPMITLTVGEKGNEQTIRPNQK